MLALRSACAIPHSTVGVIDDDSAGPIILQLAKKGCPENGAATRPLSVRHIPLGEAERKERYAPVTSTGSRRRYACTVLCHIPERQGGDSAVILADEKSYPQPDNAVS
jgi:hypothetical protein